MTFRETGLPWVPPSPHMPGEETPMYCVATGILGELGVFSVGIGYTLPFHMFASDWIDPFALAGALDALHLHGVLFRPVAFTPFYGDQKGETMRGVQLYITAPDSVNLMSLQFLFLQACHQLYPAKNPFSVAAPSRLDFFDKVLGTDRVRRAFAVRMKYGDIEGILEQDVAGFREMSRKYLLY